MVSGYSRVITAMMLPSRQSPDLLCGHWELLCGWGVVPRALVWDNESAVGKWRSGKPELTVAMNAFRGMLGIKVVLCRPADPGGQGSWWSGPTATWRPRFCPAARLTLRQTSTAD